MPRSKSDLIRSLLAQGELSMPEIAAAAHTTLVTVRNIKYRQRRPESLRRMAAEIGELRQEMRLLHGEVLAIRKQLSASIEKIEQSRKKSRYLTD